MHPAKLVPLFRRYLAEERTDLRVDPKVLECAEILFTRLDKRIDVWLDEHEAMDVLLQYLIAFRENKRLKAPLPTIDFSKPCFSTDWIRRKGRYAEYEILACGRELIGENSAAANLHAETLKREVWDPNGEPHLAGIVSLVAVHRLREVSCLYGFTRFEPAPLASDELEDVGLAVEGAPLGQQPDWLPAIEQFGEGFFVRFCPEALAQWLARPALQARTQQLRSGAAAWARAKQARGGPARTNSSRERERPEYFMAHSLAHSLMSEVALDCGYPASALKERVYLLPYKHGQAARCGVLIYTASAGHQGTLGGLVEVTRRFDRVLGSALERLRLCSGDPLCSDHDPSHADEDRMLHGAACHGCLLIAETSCEARNLFLDRALLVDTVGNHGAGFFSI